MTDEQAAELARLDTRIARLRAGGATRAKELAKVEEVRASLVTMYGRGRGRPALSEEDRRVPVTLRMRPDVVTALDELATAAGFTRARMAETLVERAAKRTKRP